MTFSQLIIPVTVNNIINFGSDPNKDKVIGQLLSRLLVYFMGNYLIICEKGETKVRVYHYDDKSLDKVKESKRIVKAQIDEVKKQWQEKQSEMDNPEEY